MRTFLYILAIQPAEGDMHFHSIKVNAVDIDHAYVIGMNLMSPLDFMSLPIKPYKSNNYVVEAFSNDAERMWEELMMELVGEDGPKSVREAIERLKGQRDAAFAELKEIRAWINADENESTFDEVQRLMIKK